MFEKFRISSRMRRMKICCLVASACLPLTAVAGDFMMEVSPITEKNEGWRFRLTPYAWAAGVSGEFAQFGLPAVSVNNSFSDVMENLDMGAMTAFEAWNGRYGIFADFMHVQLSGSGTIRAGGIAVPVGASATNTTGMLSAQFRWLDGESGYLDLMTGLRHWSLKTELSAGAPVNVSVAESVSWNDPVFGTKGLRWISENIYITGWAMIGSTTGGSDLLIDLMGGVGYQINEDVALILAYRHFTVDYQKGAFLYDSTQAGFGIGLDYRF